MLKQNHVAEKHEVTEPISQCQTMKEDSVAHEKDPRAPQLRQGITRRDLVVKGSSVAALALLAPSNVTAAPTLVTGTPWRASAARQEPKTGGTLNVTQPIPIAPFEFQQLGPHMAFLAKNVFDTLIRYDAQLQSQPRLAESWTWNAEATELTLKLRQGVTYHSGRAFTSDDVKFSIERARDPAVASQWRGYSNTITEIVLPDAATVVLRFATPNLAIFDMLSMLVMLDSATAAELEGAGQVIGTGPFRWAEYAPGDRVVLARNEEYWEEGKPYLDGIDLQIVDDKQSMVLSVESGQRDVAWQVLPQDLSRLEGHPQARPEVSQTGAQFYYIGAVTTAEGVSDKRIRQAFNAAIDRQRITETLIFGLVEPTALPWPPASPAYNEEIDATVSFDLERARTLFAEAGVGPGTTLTVEANAQDPLNAQIAQIVQADLASIEITLDLQTVENTVFQQQLNESRFQQLFANTMGFSNLSPVSFFVTAFPVRITGNASQFDAPNYIALVEQMQTATDQAALKQLYDEMDRLLLDESFNMPICQAPQGWALQQRVQGFSYDALNYVHLENVWIDG